MCNVQHHISLLALIQFLYFLKPISGKKDLESAKIMNLGINSLIP
jgi:hypothetical protein